MFVLLGAGVLFTHYIRHLQATNLHPGGRDPGDAFIHVPAAGVSPANAKSRPSILQVDGED